MLDPAQTSEKEVAQLAVIARLSDPYAYLDDLNSEEKEDGEEKDADADEEDDN